jgi:hypothetical protein
MYFSGFCQEIQLNKNNNYKIAHVHDDSLKFQMSISQGKEG